MGTKLSALLNNRWFVFISLTAVVFICFAPALQNGFTNWDDQEYVLRNTAIQSLSPGSISYLFSHFLIISYHPLTLLSLAVNYFFSGTEASGYIFTNILFQALNCCLLFIFLCQINLRKTTAFFVALLFAVHPLHVESVAWIAERKDVLFVFFFFISLIFYTRYFKTDDKRIYFLSLLFFLCSCLSKAQAVTLSLTLFLIDFLLDGKITLAKSLSKIPFILISILVGIISVKAQGGNVASFTGADFTFLQRLAFAAQNYLHYILHPLLPLRLSAFYPYPDSFQPMYYLYLPVAAMIFFGAIFYFRKNKLVIFSVLFFTFNIFFLLQLFPVGDAMMADRYSYLPSIGLFILMVCVAEHLIHKSKRKKYIVQFLAAIYFLFLAQSTFARCSVWRDGITLWSDVIKKYPHTSIAYVNRGANYYDNANTTAALNDFKKAIELNPHNSFARYNAATIYYNNSDFKNCVQVLDKIDADKSADTDAFLLKAYSENKLNDYASSLRDVEIYLSKNKTAEALTLAGLNRIMSGDYANAKKDFDAAIEKDSLYTDAYTKRGALFFQMRDTTAACNDFQKAASLGDIKVASFMEAFCNY